MLYAIELPCASEDEFRSSLGPRGSAESTVFGVIVGPIAKSKGHILLSGRDLFRAALRGRDLGVAFQHYALLPHRNLFADVALALRTSAFGNEETTGPASNVLQRVDLIRCSPVRQSRLARLLARALYSKAGPCVRRAESLSNRLDFEEGGRRLDSLVASHRSAGRPVLPLEHSGHGSH